MLQKTHCLLSMCIVMNGIIQQFDVDYIHIENNATLFRDPNSSHVGDSPQNALKKEPAD